MNRHADPERSSPVLLPLGLHRPEPGLIQILDQEGVPWIETREPLDAESARSLPRFVLLDARSQRVASEMFESLGRRVIDVRALWNGGEVAPLRSIVKTRARTMAWRYDGLALVERVASLDRAAVRARFLRALRNKVEAAGGLWARQSDFPAPFRSAFNLRVDLDEPIAEHYLAFAKKRAALGLDQATTHFVSTAAYGRDARVLDDLRGKDTQSHGHHHAVYRDPGANRRNLGRAAEILRRAGFEAQGFAGPGGRWNAGLDDAAEAVGHLYASEFSLGRDDLPFFPWRADLARFSKVLQVPIHPVCEGLFFEAGAREPHRIASYYAEVVNAKIAAGEPAFVYGHPERRLALLPEVLKALADRVTGDREVWCCSMTEFAAWWRTRASRRWSIRQNETCGLEIHREDDGGPLRLEFTRGDRRIGVDARERRTPLDLNWRESERRPEEPAWLSPEPARETWGPRSIARRLPDWERVTPIPELPDHLWRDRMKKQLRVWRESRAR